MCNKGIGFDQEEQQQQQHNQAVFGMGSPSATVVSVPGSVPGSTPSSNEENPRVKFLCSFSGSILPRPQDGKLRYVGGETRIVSLPRDIGYEELMGRMKELYEGAAVLKYQQPDEDLDALVSVVNDDDVTNMMEEYDKLGSGDGFTRLRIFLFSHPDQDTSSHFVEQDERDNERRYVDALNNLNDASEFRRQQSESSPVMSVVDEGHMAEQLFSMNLDGSIHNQRNCDIPPLPPFNLHHLNIPSVGSGQHQQPIAQRYNEIEAPWSPAYYSPQHHGHHDPRPLTEFPSSPSSARFRVPIGGELPDKCLDRMHEEYSWQQVTHQPSYDHQTPFSENVVWLPNGAMSCDKAAGFPGNILHGHNHNVFEGNNICEHCRMSFQRNQPQLEQPNMGSGYQQVTNPCAECPQIHHGPYPKEQIDPRTQTHNHERGWMLHHQLNPRVEETRAHMSGAGRLNDHYIVDGTGFPPSHVITDAHQMSLNYANHEDPRYIRAGSEVGNEGFNDQAVAAGPHIHVPAIDERPVRYGVPYPYGSDNLYQGPHGLVPAHASWRNVQHPVHGAPSYEVSSSVQPANGTINPGYFRGVMEGSPRFRIGVESPNPWLESSQKVVGFDGSSVPEYPYGHALKLNTNNLIPENQLPLALGPVHLPPDMVTVASPKRSLHLSASSSTLFDDRVVSSTASAFNPGKGDCTDVPVAARVEENGTLQEGKVTAQIENVKGPEIQSISCPEQNKNANEKHDVASLESVKSHCLIPAEERADIEKLGEKDLLTPLVDVELSANHSGIIPELIASAKKAALDTAEDVKAKAEEDTDSAVMHGTALKEATSDELGSANAHGDSELDSDNDTVKTSKIEPTKAEAEAIARGLQTIKNDDLEEIRELGAGTYGSVYHGKWKGSDVAIKRIKASCFAGRPSERERLIADFWKEALILSSLHHPNVVSFYGIVRDGPDGSLATVTEFMINGSLKQFLQKKDRTIDRRKRLIIAMDAAFGMEYLHGKNIVHFDLKCENLLVNMRDPHRPVCKIGDLGLSKVKQHTLVSGGVRGTLPWMAPELLSGKSNMVTEKIDVYSFGIVMWEVLTGDEPYADMHCASIIGGIVNNMLRPQVPTWCDPEWKSLMESCWACDPAQRPSFTEISQKLRTMAAAMNLK